jgi:hypothetical protein
MKLAGSSDIDRAARVPRGTYPDGPLLRALIEWQAAAVRQDEVDPVTTELVRLRCATHHDCHT